MIYTTLSIIILVVEVLLLGYFCYRTYYLKKVINKKVVGYFFPLFLVVYALNLMGTYFMNGMITAYDLINLISKALKAFAFEINEESIRMLADVNDIYFISTIIAHIMAGITTVTAVLGIFRRHIINAILVKKVLNSDCDIVIGESLDSIEYAKNNKNTIIWCSKFSNYELETFSKHRIPIIKKDFDAKHIDSKFRKGNRYHFIAFKDTNFSYSQIIDTFSKIKKTEKSIFYLHLESEVNEMEIVKERYVAAVDEKSNSFVTCFNKYELVARKFVTDYPMSAYVPNDFYDVNKNDSTRRLATIKKDKELNVILLGFGKVNLKLLEMMIIQNQFVQIIDGKLQPKQVNYYAYDDSKAQLSNEMFIRLLYEYEHISKDEKLPKLDRICNLKCEPINVKSLEHFMALNGVINENSFTYIIVSVGADLENAAFAKQIYENFNKKGNIKVFARFKENNDSINKNVDDTIVCFGEKGNSFTHDIVVNNTLMDISQKVNSLYKKLHENELQQIQKWEKLPLIKQYANIYNALSIYFKMGLLGYKICDKDDISEGYQKISEKEYQESYYYETPNENFQYHNYFDINNRNILAFSEHLRWNAYYYLSDYKPMNLDDVLLVNDKLVTQSAYLKQHACLTTWEGLDILHQKMLNESRKIKTETSINDVEVYKYDYMLMDEAYKTLDNHGYKIVKEKQK